MTARRFIDVLNWGALVAPGVMACKDGSLLAGWEVTGIDSESMEPEALAGELLHVGVALSRLSDGETVWSVFERRPWVPDAEPERVGHDALDAVTLESHLRLADPGTTWSDRLLLFLGRRPATSGALGEMLAEFREAREGLESRLGSVFGLSRLVPEGPGAPCPFRGALTGLLGQARSAPRSGESDLPVGLDILLGTEVLQPRRAGPLTLDARALAVLALEGLSVTYGLAPFERFQALPCAFSGQVRRPLVSLTSWSFRMRRYDSGQDSPEYSASVTCSIQVTLEPSSASWIAMWVIPVSGAAPCQWRSSGANQTTSPERIS